MAKILYGVSGEGSGHSSRAKEIITHLKESGHEIKILSYGRGFKNLSRNFEVFETEGLGFAYKNNEINYLSTIIKNAIKLPKFQKSVKETLKLIDEFEPRIVFSDFEPISCIAANLKKLPLISIDNQHRLTNTKIEYPEKYKIAARAAKAITNTMVFNSTTYLVISFENSEVVNKKTFIFPPILRKEIFKIRPSNKNYILIYLTFEFSGIIDILKSINKKFIIYGFNKDTNEENLIFKQYSEKEFLKDLANSEAVLANAGFTLISEALYLKKPYLAIPLKNHFEQVLNACFIEKNKYGEFYDEINKEKIEKFISKIGFYKESLKSYPKTDNSKIFAKIEELIKRYSL